MSSKLARKMFAMHSIPSPRFHPAVIRNQVSWSAEAVYTLPRLCGLFIFSCKTQRAVFWRSCAGCRKIHYAPRTPRKSRRVHDSSRTIQPKLVVHSVTEFLFAAQVAFRRLYRDVAQEELDLFPIATCKPDERHLVLLISPGLMVRFAEGKAADYMVNRSISSDTPLPAS